MESALPALAYHLPFVTTLYLIGLSPIHLSSFYRIPFSGFPLIESLSLESCRFPSFRAFASTVASFQELKSLDGSGFPLESGTDDSPGAIIPAPPASLFKVTLGGPLARTLKWLTDGPPHIRVAKLTSYSVDELPSVARFLRAVATGLEDLLLRVPADRRAELGKSTSLGSNNIANILQYLIVLPTFPF
jgi:hypothetical protein